MSLLFPYQERPSDLLRYYGPRTDWLRLTERRNASFGTAISTSGYCPNCILGNQFPRFRRQTLFAIDMKDQIVEFHPNHFQPSRPDLVCFIGRAARSFIPPNADGPVQKIVRVPPVPLRSLECFSGWYKLVSYRCQY